ncbi:hypothetical protein [Microcystis sp. M49636_WE2]|uniref:hypothetical protein n=1 Tax=Microcystis sp. M49636_WE2 TaxID=3030679 RepID=UPI00258E07B5|nr:hypothetical protein [Microcystis sp. M49636_WE2]
MNPSLQHGSINSKKSQVVIELVEMWPIMDGFDKLTVHDRPGNLGVRCLETA